MGTNNIVLEVIEWFDETGREIVHRIPENGSGDIKYSAAFHRSGESIRGLFL